MTKYKALGLQQTTGNTHFIYKKNKPNEKTK